MIVYKILQDLQAPVALTSKVFTPIESKFYYYYLSFHFISFFAIIFDTLQFEYFAIENILSIDLDA